MTTAVSIQSEINSPANWLIVGVCADANFSPIVEEIDGKLNGALSRLKEQNDLKGKTGELTVILNTTGIEAERLLIVGLGDPNKITIANVIKTFQTASRKISTQAETSIVVDLSEEACSTIGTAQATEAIVYALFHGAAGQDFYKKEQDHTPFEKIELHTSATNGTPDTVQTAATRGQILGEAANLTRELVSRHPSDIIPETFANRSGDIAADLGLRGEILEPHELESENMNALLAVARGSDREARVVVLEYNGAGPDAPRLGLCGKGVTFDSGGLSIKPSAGMIGMKADMAGAATVLGAMTAIAKLKLPVNVTGVMGLVENMVSGNSYLLGEVITARNGTTIEIHNTDAEGRLVLADILSYAVDKGCDKLIDLATLTGACVVALGEEVTGVFSNNEPWQQSLLDAARDVDELAWPMPMHDAFADQLKSDFADTKNIGTRWGGAITAAKFLEKFVDETPWIHLDIAGPAFAETSKGHQDAGGTGAMVRTLVELARRFNDRK